MKYRVRFAPSPTGALHIGGVRTALYNYLLAKQTGGDFILRIEDTDQTRFVPGAEDYIIEALSWCGLIPDEGVGFGGAHAPYRQSDRKEIYFQYAKQLIDSGHAYYAFDTAEALQAQRELLEAQKLTFKYDATVRDELDNSLNMSAATLEQKLQQNEPYTIRLKVPKDEIIVVQDLIRGEVHFNSNELDDKVLLKVGGMPTYHLANIVDDYLMKVTHVIRGEEWLPSTAHHVLLYRFLGWETAMPTFSHLPLILKPDGKGKLSKRDGAKFGFPVFPLSWTGETPEDSFIGFREFGFLPEAVVNFLAFLGWNPGTEQEIFSIEELIAAFSIEKISKSGARFDIDKAKWYNQQYIIASTNEKLAQLIRPLIEAKGFSPAEDFLVGFCGLMKERVTLLPDFWENGSYFFEGVTQYDDKAIQKNWKADNRNSFDQLLSVLAACSPFDSATLESTVKAFIQDHKLKMGEVLQIFRLAISGTLKGASVFDMAALLGREEVIKRFETAYQYFDDLK